MLVGESASWGTSASWGKMPGRKAGLLDTGTRYRFKRSKFGSADKSYTYNVRIILIVLKEDFEPISFVRYLVMIHGMFQVIRPEALLLRNRHLHPITRTMNDVWYFLNQNEFRVELEDFVEKIKNDVRCQTSDCCVVTPFIL